jgi:hypothetical protein
MKKTITLFLMIFPFCLGIKAQNLVVTLNNSTIETIPIATIQGIKFGTSSMILNEFDGTVTTWNIQDLLTNTSLSRFT